MKNLSVNRKIFITMFVVGFLTGLLLISNQHKTDALPGPGFSELARPEEAFVLEKGDLLVRPNLNWFPGTSSVSSGRNFGHIAIIVQGSKGKTIDDALKNSLIVEAIIFDQSSRKFEFNSRLQVRKVTAITSFGPRFAGIRYHLRTLLSQDQKDKMCQFLLSQISGHGYNPFSSKGEHLISEGLGSSDVFLEGKRWNCATLVWFAYKFAAGIDIDSNGGIFIYPNDCIRSKYFDKPQSRFQF